MNKTYFKRSEFYKGLRGVRSQESGVRIKTLNQNSISNIQVEQPEDRRQNGNRKFRR